MGKILLVEANYGDASTTTLILERAGIPRDNIVHHDNTADALQAWRAAKTEIALVVTGTLHSSKWAGNATEMVQEMRADRPGLPVVTMSLLSAETLAANYAWLAHNTRYVDKHPVESWAQIGNIARQAAPSLVPSG